MMSETRGVITSFDKPICNQEAIPWCTTHDNIAGTTEKGCKGFTRWNATSGYDCVISTGGSDHKWWVDT